MSDDEEYDVPRSSNIDFDVSPFNCKKPSLFQPTNSESSFA